MANSIVPGRCYQHPRAGQKGVTPAVVNRTTGVLAGLALAGLLALHGSAPQNVVAATVPLDATALAQQHSLQVPCAVNGDSGTCALDTGNNGAVVMNPVQARVARVVCTQQVTLATVGGTTQGCTGPATLTFGGRSLTVTVEVDPAWNWVPLIGIPAMQAVWPQGFTVDFAHGDVCPLPAPVAARARR